MKLFIISILIILIATITAFVYIGTNNDINTDGINGKNLPPQENTSKDSPSDAPEIDPKQPITHNDLIKLTYPLPQDSIDSPLTITGEARGQWFFEGSFPVVLTNWNGLIIAEGVATSTEPWMTTEYIPFSVTLEFPKEASGARGFLILQKDNPSGLPENDDALEIMVFYK